MKLHTLKCWLPFYEQLASGRTTDIRHNDRDFKAGDLIQYVPYKIGGLAPATEAEVNALGGPPPTPTMLFRVSYVGSAADLTGYAEAVLNPDYVALSVERVVIVPASRLGSLPPRDVFKPMGGARV